MSHYNVECVVLKSTNYQDADKIFVFFGKNKGKFSAVAKGVRKISSRRSGNLDILNHVVLGISESSSGFKIVTEAKTIDSFLPLKKSMEGLVYGYYVLELVYRLLEEGVADDKIFNLLTTVLRNMAQDGATALSEMVLFEVGFIEALGYGMTLDRCVVCGRLYDGSWSKCRFKAEVGGFVCDRCSGGVLLSGESSAFLYSVKLKDISGAAFLPATILEADRLIGLYLRNILESDIR